MLEQQDNPSWCKPDKMKSLHGCCTPAAHRKCTLSVQEGCTTIMLRDCLGPTKPSVVMTRSRPPWPAAMPKHQGESTCTMLVMGVWQKDHSG
jgi:hypothetical protein